MGVTVNALKRGLAEVAIPVGDETLTVEYRPGLISPGFNGEHWFDLPQWLATVVARWDLEDDGGVVPLRQPVIEADGSAREEPSEALRALPNDFLLLVQREINRDLLPGKRLRATSAGG